jgi:hypothetical protein
MSDQREPRGFEGTGLTQAEADAYIAGRREFERRATQAEPATAGPPSDDALEALDLSPETFRTEGGTINRGKLRAAILHPYNYLPPDHWMQARFSKPGGRPAAVVTDDMVMRFLGWPLPKDFCPDCGISFDGRKDDQWNKNKTWPIGTNLLTADQARAMLEHVLATQAASDQPAQAPAAPAEAVHIAWLHRCLREFGACIDGGACHHECSPDGECFRAKACVPLTGSGLAEDWTLAAPQTAQPPQEPAEPLPQFYVGGPFLDGAFAVCEMATGRVLRKFRGEDDLRRAAGVEVHHVGLQTFRSTGVADAAQPVAPAARSDDLLAALREAADRIEGIKGGSVSDTIALMRAAIAKAEQAPGQAPSGQESPAPSQDTSV